MVLLYVQIAQVVLIILQIHHVYLKVDSFDVVMKKYEVQAHGRALMRALVKTNTIVYANIKNALIKFRHHI